MRGFFFIEWHRKDFFRRQKSFSDDFISSIGFKLYFCENLIKLPKLQDASGKMCHACHLLNNIIVYGERIGLPPRCLLFQHPFSTLLVRYKKLSHTHICSDLSKPRISFHFRTCSSVSKARGAKSTITCVCVQNRFPFLFHPSVCINH